jgi:TniQ
LTRTYDEYNLPDDYEHWELAMPPLPPRSVLYQIRPIGIGTAETECLTSYLARLANAHHLAVGHLIIRYFLPILKAERMGTDRPLNSFRLTKMCFANGADAFATDMIGLTERLTLSNGIAPTTLVLWGDVVPRLELLRDFRAWCSNCYAEQTAGGGANYDLLSWAILPVKVCPRHRHPLTESCPDCKKRIWPVLSQYHPGFCPYCRAWLGTRDKRSAPVTTTLAVSDMDYELWVANNIGAVIAATPALSTAPARQNVIAAVQHCCNLLMEGNSRMVARLFGVANTTPRNWLSGEAIPPLRTLARLSYLSKVPLLNLLTDPASVLEYISKHPVEIIESQNGRIQHLHRVNNLSCQKVREQMEAALKEIPPPSLIEVARRLGYQHQTTLRVKFPELSKKITANYRKSEKYLSGLQAKRAEAERRLDKKSQKKVFKQELNQPCPATLDDLAHRFGYTNSGSLRRRFPDLCQALMEKRRQYQQRQLTQRLNHCRKILNEALTEYPPPSLSSVARRFEGVRMTEFLRKHFRAECRSICERYIGYREKRMQNAGDRLRQSLRENPPPSLNQLSKEIGYHMTTLQQCYPELSRSIMARYEDHIRKLRQIRVR